MQNSEGTQSKRRDKKQGVIMPLGGEGNLTFCYQIPQVSIEKSAVEPHYLYQSVQ